MTTEELDKALLNLSDRGLNRLIGWLRAAVATTPTKAVREVVEEFIESEEKRPK